MSYVKVDLIVDDRIYSVNVDENADPQKLARGLARKLKLPKNENYRIKLVGDIKIRPGATLELVKVADDELFSGLSLKRKK